MYTIRIYYIIIFIDITQFQTVIYMTVRDATGQRPASGIYENDGDDQ